MVHALGQIIEKPGIMQIVLVRGEKKEEKEGCKKKKKRRRNEMKDKGRRDEGKH